MPAQSKRNNANILISACLLGHPVRYDGATKTMLHPAIEKWLQEGRLISLCPEISAGFTTPRAPAEIANGLRGQDVLSGTAKVMDLDGVDVTHFFITGAEIALKTAITNHCRYALLTDGSPSCGSRFIYDGRFQNKSHVGSGVTTALLRNHGIEVFAHSEIDELVLKIDAAPLTS